MDSPDFEFVNIDLAITQKRLQEVLIAIQDQNLDADIVEEGLSAAHTMKALAAVKGAPHLESFAAQLSQAFIRIQQDITQNKPVELATVLMPIAREFNQACRWIQEDTTGSAPPKSKVSTKLTNLVESIRVMDKQQTLERPTEEIKQRPLGDEVLLSSIFGGFIPWLHQVAEANSKELKVEMSMRKPILIPISKVEALQAIFVHLLRNAIFHGIETSHVREIQKKPACGTIEWNAYIQDGHLVMVLSDDGKGIPSDISPESTWRLDNTICSTTNSLSDTSIFSVSNQQTGLGLGLHIVKKQVENLRGDVEIMSVLGIGTSVTIKIPVA